MYIRGNIDIKLKDLSNQFEEYFLNIVDQISLNNKWDIKESIDIEIKKSFVRGLLRYSSHSLNITNNIKNIFKELEKNNNKYRWITLPYPMIHLSGDKVEDGGFHYDNDSEKNSLFTCWIPIRDYEYDALKILKFKSKKINLIFSKFLKLNLTNFFSNNLGAKKGNFYIWPGYILHAGNLNLSENISCAVQLKISEEVYDYEQNGSLHKNQDINDDFCIKTNFQILDEYKEYQKLINKVLKNEKNDYYEICKDHNSKIIKKSMHLSFALSTLSQRIQSKKKYFQNITDISKVSKCLDLLSLLIGSANLICFKRLIEDKNIKQNELINFLKENDKFNCVPFNSVQFNSVLKKNANDLKVYKF